jgi:hypothetical protein
MTTRTLEVGNLFSILGASGIERQLRRIDGVGRVSVNPVSGSTTVAYDAADRVVGSTISGPSGSQTTTLHLDNLGRVYQTDKPDGSSVFTVFTSAGQVAKSWGSGGSDTYPTEYTYDTQGRMKTLKTWKDFNAAAGTGLSSENIFTFWAADGADRPGPGHFKGQFFLDGSGYKGALPGGDRAGWSLIEIDALGDLVAAIGAPVPVELPQTSQAGE